MVDYFIFFTQKTKFFLEFVRKISRKKGAFLKYFKKIAYVGLTEAKKSVYRL